MYKIIFSNKFDLLWKELFSYTYISDEEENAHFVCASVMKRRIGNCDKFTFNLEFKVQM